MQHPVRDAFSPQGVPQEARLESYAELLAEDGHPLDIGWDLDLFEFSMRNFLALKQLKTENLAFPSYAEAHAGPLAHCSRGHGLAPFGFHQLVDVSLSSIQS